MRAKRANELLETACDIEQRSAKDIFFWHYYHCKEHKWSKIVCEKGKNSKKWRQILLHLFCVWEDFWQFLKILGEIRFLWNWKNINTFNAFQIAFGIQNSFFYMQDFHINAMHKLIVCFSIVEFPYSLTVNQIY